ncbi:hypothetical protein BOTNAR_0099g00280 [Botryotinia narcissicola]|uniref:OPT family small oligopeptide transporter n=1 Tax=Botryotinia narcissicola TaxID=278944 RepID=A0A4Z1IPL5_9HELO|nr:hypothetical protein BOTNAR_0099g00280 [Botryotinia narcissicola]
MDSPRETDVVYDEKSHEAPVVTKNPESIDSKDAKNDKFGETPYETEISSGSDEEGRGGEVTALETAEDIVTAIINVDDDPTLNPWTFRMFFIGLGLSVFGAVLQEIFYFKPQVIYVSVMFLTVIAYAIGEFMAFAIPRWGAVGRFLNPGPFNQKEHAAAVIMASAAAVSALSTEALAAQKLWYGGYPSQAAGVFLTLFSQLIGYGVAGMMRSSLLWPTKMLYPANLPVTTVLETLHKEKKANKKRMKVFWIIFFALLVWELLPEYIFPLLIGVSIFCLADQHNLVFTNLFGGANGNEGLGFLSLSFDWNYVASFGSPLWMPLHTLVNSFIGTLGCIILFMAVYYGNIWRAQDFPFLSQQLFNSDSNFTFYDTFNETTILNDDFTVNEEALEAGGIPYMASTYIVYLITSNMGFTANFVHMFLWNYEDIKAGWAWANKATLKKLLTPSHYMFWKGNGSKRSEEEKQILRDDPNIDPHYKVMLDYDEVPDFWYFLAFAASFITSMACLYAMKSTLPWWGLILAMLFLTVFMLFFGAQYAITGFQFNIEPIAQTLAGYLFPGAPLANMYFTTFTFNALQQGQYLLRDLKLAQQNKLSPKVTYTTQIIGCIFGACLNYVMMITIVKNQVPNLLTIEGTPIWSGANVQSFNSLAIAWSIAPKMFSIGARYQWVTIAYLLGFLVPVPFWLLNKYFPRQRIWSYLNLSIILWYFGYLCVGINASVFMYYYIGAFGQFYLRKWRPKYFIKWNYLVSAGLVGGTQVMLFLLTFAVAGGSGVSRPFPEWAGNAASGNVDKCMYNEANG